LSGYILIFSQGKTELVFASSFKSFGVALAGAAFKCACKTCLSIKIISHA
jgi:hypothetical protein